MKLFRKLEARPNRLLDLVLDRYAVLDELVGECRRQPWGSEPDLLLPFEALIRELQGPAVFRHGADHVVRGA